jgi:predicted nuclease of predicted toxin-antitoxin system
MRFLTDQDVYGVTVRLLGELGHDTLPVSKLGLQQATDEELLRFAVGQGRILVTRDRDFGSLVFVKRLSGGVIYLRISPSSAYAVHKELEFVLSSYSQQQLLNSFVVVEPNRHRIRRGSG